LLGDATLLHFPPIKTPKQASPHMHLWLVDCIQLGMNAMDQAYTDLLNEYRIALGLWSEVRAHYSPDQLEVIAATSHVEAVEQELASFRQPAALAA
jgi:hypothetical protein